MNPLVTAQLEKIARTLAPIADARSIVVVGSWARGDARWRDSSAGVILESDIDLYAISDAAWTRARVQAVQQQLSAAVQSSAWSLPEVDASQLAIDLHLASFPQLQRLPVTVRLFDLKNDSQVLWGEDRRDRLPTWSAADMPPYEGLRLLFNRPYYMAGSISRAMFTDSDWLAAQAVKNYRACALALSLLIGQYRSRPDEVLSALPSDELSTTIRQGLSAPGTTLATWRHSLDVLEATFQRVAAHMTGVSGEAVWDQLPRVYLRPYALTAAQLRLGFVPPTMLLDFVIRALRAWRGVKWKRRYTEARWLFDDPIFGIYRSLWEACLAVKADGSIDFAGLERPRTALHSVLGLEKIDLAREEVIALAAQACDSYYGAAWRTRGSGGEVRIRSID